MCKLVDHSKWIRRQIAMGDIDVHSSSSLASNYGHLTPQSESVWFLSEFHTIYIFWTRNFSPLINQCQSFSVSIRRRFSVECGFCFCAYVDIFTEHINYIDTKKIVWTLLIESDHEFAACAKCNRYMNRLSFYLSIYLLVQFTRALTTFCFKNWIIDEPITSSPWDLMNQRS